jgi:ferric-dicitrate binding protein FerR (iron transport regulator)
VRKNRVYLLAAGRKFVCAALAVVLPASLMADEASAMLHHDGGALLNGNPAPASIAILPNDTVQTRAQNGATITLAGSSVTLDPETLVQFESDAIVLDHGMLHVNTSRELTVRVGCINVIPTTSNWTQYDVTDLDGRVTVAARKSDVDIDSRGPGLVSGQKTGISQRVTVREGEQKTREEHCGAAQQTPSHIAAKGAILNSPYVKWPAAAAAIFGTCWVFCRGDDPVSPSKP